MTAILVKAMADLRRRRVQAAVIFLTVLLSIATGTMAQILGQDGAVRVRVTGLPATSRADLNTFGNLEDEGEWLTFRGLNPDRVPQLVDEIVRQGGRVYAVEPRHETLEDRFLQLLKEQDQ